MEPNINSEVKGALFAPTGGIIGPFEYTIALMENAVQNGGEETANPSYIFPQNVVLDYYFSNQTVCGSGNEQIEISGLTPWILYLANFRKSK